MRPSGRVFVHGASTPEHPISDPVGVVQALQTAPADSTGHTGPAPLLDR